MVDHVEVEVQQKDPTVFTYEFRYSSKLTAKKMEALYKSLSNMTELNGFKSFNPEEPNFILSSKSNKYYINSDQDSVDIFVANTFSKNRMHWTLSDQRQFMGVLLDVFEENKIAVTSFNAKREEYVLSKIKGKTVAQKIFLPGMLGADKQAFTVRFMQHEEDSRFDTVHIHSFSAILNAVFPPMNENEAYVEALKELNSFIASKEYTFEKREGDEFGGAEMVDILEKYYVAAKEEVHKCFRSLLLSEG